MELRVRKYNTIEAWTTANKLAHSICKYVKGYTSNNYMSIPIETIDGFLILLELKGFEKELQYGVGDFQSIDDSIIKVNEI